MQLIGVGCRPRRVNHHVCRTGPLSISPLAEQLSFGGRVERLLSARLLETVLRQKTCTGLGRLLQQQLLPVLIEVIFIAQRTDSTVRSVSGLHDPVAVLVILFRIGHADQLEVLERSHTHLRTSIVEGCGHVHRAICYGLPFESPCLMEGFRNGDSATLVAQVVH